MTELLTKHLGLFDQIVLDSEWPLFDSILQSDRTPPPQLLKWIGNKQRFASTIANIFPQEYNRYFEPFVGSGAVLGAMAPHAAVAADVLEPLIGLWQMLQNDPDQLHKHYEDKWHLYAENPKQTYTAVLNSYNDSPNALDFAFISRTCYGGVIRFTKSGRMSTPMGPHKPISPESFRTRMILWRNRVKNTIFTHASFEETMSNAGAGDIVYCDPPYVDSQKILYGAQAFDINALWEKIAECKARGANVALSIDGHKKSGSKVIELNMPDKLFERQLLIDNGSSMLKRFQKKDEIMTGEGVHDRLLLTW